MAKGGSHRVFDLEGVSTGWGHEPAFSFFIPVNIPRCSRTVLTNQNYAFYVGFFEQKSEVIVDSVVLFFNRLLNN